MEGAAFVGKTPAQVTGTLGPPNASFHDPNGNDHFDYDGPSGRVASIWFRGGVVSAVNMNRP